MATWTETIIFYILLVFMSGYMMCLHPKAKFYIKLGYANLMFLIPAALTIMTMPFLGCGPHNNLTMARIANLMAYPLGIKWVIKDQRKGRTGKSVMFVGNHQSMLDVLGQTLFYPLTYPCHVVMKKELLRTGLPGLFWYLSGAVLINRKNTTKAKAKLAKALEQIKSTNHSMWVYPEGTRNANGTILPFKGGAFYMAVEAQIPLSPVVFSNYNHFFNYNEQRFDCGVAEVTFLPEISTEGLTTADVPKLRETVRELMLEHFNPTQS